MYKSIKKIEECGFIGLYQENQVLQKRDILSKKKFGQWYAEIVSWDFEPIWQSEDERAGNVELTDNFLKYNVNFEKTIFRKFTDLNNIYFELNLPTSLDYNLKEPNMFYGATLKDDFFKLNLLEKQLTIYPNLNPSFSIKHITNNHIIRVQDFASKIVISDLNYTTLWERNISIEGQHKHWMDWEESKKNVMEPGRIKSVILYQEKYVIICMESSDCICLELSTGKEIWRNIYGSVHFYTMHKNIAYCTTGRGLWKMNLDTGSIEKYNWEHSALPNFKYNGADFKPVVHDIQFHEGLLWFIAYDNSTGFSFVIAIHPETGNYEWIHKVDSKHKVMSMKFHKNRMYLNSTRDLIVYEKI